MDSKAPNDPASMVIQDYEDADCFRVEAHNHAFTFYPSGSQRLSALIDFIESAKASLYVFYYMFQDDPAGTQVRDALVQAAKRGVDVRLIIDAFGSDSPDEFFNPLQEAGGQFARFSASWGARYLIRNHQKFVIADQTRVMTGGANVSQAYFDPPTDNGWCDLGVQVDGALASQFVRWFALLRAWIVRDKFSFRLLRRMIKNWDPGDGEVQLLVGGPLVRGGNWNWRFRKDLAQAKRLDTVSAYFAPPRSLRRQFARLAERGELRMITAGKSDMDASIDVARLHYKKLLQAGAAIHEFQPCKLHMKLLIVDGVSYFGSANLDKRSIRLNVELMVRVDDQALAKRLRELVDHLETGSFDVEDQWYAKRATFFNRLRWRVLDWLWWAEYRASLKLNQ